MARPPTLSFDRGTLLLHPPPQGNVWLDYAVWDDRVERFRLPAWQYRRLVEALQAEGAPLHDQALAFALLPPVSALEMTQYPHQRAALAAWLAAGRRGGIVLPTGAGKTYLAHLLASDFSTFEVESPLEPTELRRRVFALSAQTIPSPRHSVATLTVVADALNPRVTSRFLDGYVS